MLASELYVRAVDERRGAESRQALIIALVFAAILHYPLLHTALLIAQVDPGDANSFQPWEVTEVSLLDGLDLSEEMTLQEREEAEERLKDKPELEPKPDDSEIRQIVRLPPQPDTRPPEKPTDRGAKFDSRTDKEMKKHGDPTAPGDGPKVPSAQPGLVGQQEAQISPERPSPVPSQELAMLAPGDERPEREAIPDHPRRRQLKLLNDGESELKLSPEMLTPSGQPASKRRGYQALLPPIGAAGGGGGEQGTDTPLFDVEEGEQTLLNARRFKYWGYFNRIHESIKRNWRPGQEYRRADPSGRVYGVKDRMTVLTVRLDRHGTLLDLAVREGSGIAPLDDEALRAFRAAEPFPNPPSGLVGDDGTIQFSFGFFLDIKSGWDFRPLRLPNIR